MHRKAGLFTHLDTVLLRVRNIDQARSWYELKLGVKVTYSDPIEGLAIFDPGGATSITLWQLKPGETLPAPGAATAFPIFATADAKSTHDALRSLNVIVDEIQEGSGVRYFGFRDLDGNRLEVCELMGSAK